MNDESPMIKDSVPETLNAIIDSLQFINASLTQIEINEKVSIESIHSIILGAAHFVNCTRLAAEACYAQYKKPTEKLAEPPEPEVIEENTEPAE